MAAEAAENLAAENPCCATWKRRYSKLEEKRNALRQAVNLLNKQIDKIQTENLNLKKGYEEEMAQAENEKEQKEKLMLSLENEISKLKSEISLLQQKEGSNSHEKDEELKHLKDCVSERDEEIRQLKELSQKEKRRVDAEKKKAEVEKKKAAEALKQVKSEKGKIDEERRLACIEVKKAEEYRIQLESLKKEINETKSKLICETVRFEEARKKSEAEKRNVMQVRKRADSAMAEADKQRKLAEANEKKAREEKSRVENLSQQLDEARQRNEELQKEIDQLVMHRHTSKAPHDQPDKRRDVTIENEKVKLLNKRLKFEKSRVKHAKQVAKLEERRNKILQQELGHWKLEFIHFSQRLFALDKYFSPGNEGIDGLKKAGNFTDMRGLNLKDKVVGLEPFPEYPRSENQLFKPSRMAASDLRNLEEPGSLIPSSGPNSIKSISGIDSKLESLLGGSNQKMLQSSAINSSTTSFFDGQLVGSQERGATSVSTSTKFLEENMNALPTVSRMLGEVTTMRCNDGMVAENSVRSSSGVDGVGSGDGHDRKRKTLPDTVESIEPLYSENKKLQLIEERLAVLHGMLRKHMKEPSEEAKYVEKELQGGSYTERNRLSKKRKASHESPKHSSGNGRRKKKGKTKTIFSEDSNIGRPAGNLKGNDGPCRDNVIDSVAGDLQETGSFEEIGDYLKLLELDDATAEERYRMAIEMPLSPTLPDIELQDISAVESGNFNPLIEESFCGGLSNTKENKVSSSSFDVVNMEINLNSLNHDAPGTPCGSLLQKSVHRGENHANTFCKGMEMGKPCNKQTGDSGTEAEMSTLPIAGDKWDKYILEDVLGSAFGIIPKQCVIFSDMDNTSISRIFCAASACMVRCSLDTQTEWVVLEILHALEMEERLSSKEKACVFVSLLLLNFSVAIVDKSGEFWHKDLLPCLDSLAGQMRQVMQNVEARNLFIKLCCFREVLRLIKDFLMEGRVVVCTDISSKSLFEGDPRINNILLDGVNITTSLGGASALQLVAGSIVLASICAVVDDIGFICEVSYSLLHMQRHDMQVLLTILHIFAHLGGEKMFTLKAYSLTTTILKLIVTFLERGSPSAAQASCSVLFTCGRCPFYQDVASLDDVISLLLEKIETYVPPGDVRQDIIESASLLSSSSLPQESSAMESLICEEDPCAHGVKCDPSCCLMKFEMPASQSHAVINHTFCDIIDVLSLVELLARNLSWEWTYEKIALRLLEMLETPTLGTLNLSVVILLGQLGRLGVDAGGFEDKGVDHLRRKLSAFLSQEPNIVGLPIQIATVNVLLGLLSLEFVKVVQGEPIMFTAVPNKSATVDLIRNWFCRLSKEQQALSLSLL
ncbi:hypothetical protein HS088_TW09G00459 [Tripterygium wilfordii]|uniref:Maternal effect embryo arrest 22 n=1 Tax=Tripterygium wilfordii TaxID=458696 RepID=A0A7J7D7X0_TRIWF|nr:uncharacterized protein LOC120006708 [Tripterygium wilfordii]KAF5742411.1 hypothetical protein HS088_TW09G00459 [Tripterygium wilfordii]